MNENLLKKRSSTPPCPNSLEQKMFWIFGGILLLFLSFYGIRPLYDPDFWWHLKSGEFMVKSGGLLQADPFTFSGDGVVSVREAVILKGYWLWQITAYGLYSLFSFNGIFLLNLLTVGAMAGVVFQQLRRQQVGCALTALLMTSGFFLLSSIYPLARPQVVSFLFAALLLALLTRVRDGRPLGWWTLPLLMMIWSNMHGGFVVGDLILLCFAAGAMIEYRHDFSRVRHILLWTGIGIGASLLNPNGILVFSEVFSFQNSALMTGVSEYQSTWVKFQQGRWFVVILWLLIALYGVGIWRMRRIFWPEFFVTLFLAAFSVAYMRNVGFFAVAMLPAIGFNLQQGRSLCSLPILPACKYFVIFITAVFLLWQTNFDWRKGRKTGNSNLFTLEESTDFILSSGIQGRMFNSYESGGYFLWKLYPQHRVFIDGRGLSPDVFRDWKAMTAASLEEVQGRKEFEVLLDRYGIDYVVQPHIYYDSGRLTPLLKFLMVKPEWIPVYVDHQSYILVRNSPLNSAVIVRCQMDKYDFNNKIIGYLRALCNNRPSEVIPHVALSEMLIFVGRYAEAEERLAVITRLQPDNPNLPSLRNQLAVLKNGKRP
jgi:hypothetical protein